MPHEDDPERLMWDERRLFEDYAHAACMLLTEDFEIHRARTRRFGHGGSGVGAAGGDMDGGQRRPPAFDRGQAPARRPASNPGPGGRVAGPVGVDRVDRSPERPADAGLPPGA